MNERNEHKTRGDTNSTHRDKKFLYKIQKRQINFYAKAAIATSVPTKRAGTKIDVHVVVFITKTTKMTSQWGTCSPFYLFVLSIDPSDSRSFLLWEILVHLPEVGMK